MPYLVANGLAKSFKSRQVVNGISLEVNSGEIVGLLGPNGAGKTTCFYMLVGLIPPDEGAIFLNNVDVTKAPMHQRAKSGMSYLPQESSVFRKLSVSENILSILETRQDLSKAERLTKLESLLEDFHITHIRDNLGMSLSGGERRRVEIARAMATEPNIILLDEPFAGVDPISVLDIKQFIRQLKDKGVAVLITDHNVRDTLDICQTAAIVSEGQIIASGNPQEIISNQQVKDVYLGEQFAL